MLVIFCSGACSQLDTWDYKPELAARHGQPMPGGKLITFQGEQGNLTRSPWKFRPRGGSSPFIRFLVGILLIVGSTIFLGCPIKVVLRAAAGELAA